MVTDEERDYMWSEYAKDPRMKLNLGIVRRLATLVDNDRRAVELLHSLLFSLPGSPVLYYGDEIGMGDNVYLRDRDGVRTPMQWTPDRNGGFSHADFAQLYLPPLMDPVYGFQAVNVEAQVRNPSSLLHWMHRMLEVRRQHPVFGTGSMEVVSTDNPSVLAYVRAPEGYDSGAGPNTGRGLCTDAPVTDVNVALCVSNLSRLVQPAQLQLHRWQGMTPLELLGRCSVPSDWKAAVFRDAAALWLLLVRSGERAMTSSGGHFKRAGRSLCTPGCATVLCSGHNSLQRHHPAPRGRDCLAGVGSGPTSQCGRAVAECQQRPGS